MNKLKSINIIALALQAISAVLLFKGDVFNLKWGDPESFFGRSESTASFYSKFNLTSEGKILGLAFFVFLSIVIIALILQIVSKKYYIITLVSSMFQLIVFLVYNNIYEETNPFDNYIYTYSPGAFYYLIIAIFIIVIITLIVGVVVSKRTPEESQASTSIVTTSNTSNADELKKFKELLDSGVITQEEFEAKKKQLLGL